MAFEDDIRALLEERLLAFDPTLDVSPGSPLQVKVIDPVVERVGTDPFSTDTATFIRDRILQDFPDLVVDGGGNLEDLLSSPLQLALEPLRRAIQTVKTNQSVNNASLMSDDDADALGANFFINRDEGDFAAGLVRVFFAAPTTARISTDKRFLTNGGLAFFPTQNTFITSQEMLFNRFGDLFFVDVPVRAEEQGEEYNVEAAEISSVEDVAGVVRVANLSKFSSGEERQSNEEYLGSIPQALTERSLVTVRGVATRVPDTFAGIRALQVVGAGEVGMDRDILEGTGEGFLHIAAKATLYGSWLFVSEIVYKDDGPDDNIVVQAGDVIRFQLDATTDPALTVYSSVVRDLFSSNVGTINEQYILLLESSIDPLVPVPVQGRIALYKPGFITISGVPGGLATNIQVPDGEVHLGGHTDVFIRPNSDEELQVVLSNVIDAEPLIALQDLEVLGTPVAPTNLVESVGIAPSIPATNFVVKGVQPGDLLVIEEGTDIAGTYVILSVGSVGFAGDTDFQLRVDALITATGSELRARIVRSIAVDLVEPKTPKLPFDTGSVSDLSVTIGSTLFRFNDLNIQDFGAEVGDTIRVLDGPNAGDYIIQDFDGVLGGQGAIVDRVAAASAANLRYEVFTLRDGLTLPLVRVKSMELLDSSNQGTGIAVPYGDAVDIRPLCDFDGAGNEIRVLDRQIFVMPDAYGILGDENGPLVGDVFSTVALDHDTRYLQQLSVADGFVRALAADGSNPITEFEINIPPFVWSGKSDTLLAFPTRQDFEFTIDPTGTHRTSDVAEARVGDSIVILDGPNRGKYLIRDLRVLEMWALNAHGHRKVALVQVEPPFRVDPVRSAMKFMDDAAVILGGGATFTPLTASDVLAIFSYATDFDIPIGTDPNSFWNIFTDNLQKALSDMGFSITLSDLQDIYFDMVRTGYEVGPSARGRARAYFKEPVSVELFAGEEPTLFRLADGTDRIYRLEFDTPDAQILPEAEGDPPPSEWNRNSVVKYVEFGDSTEGDMALLSGSAFPTRGILAGDVYEFYRSVDDLTSRGDMKSSFLCVTKAGTNIVHLIVPNNPDNKVDPQAGQLLFIDSGPDIGFYLITRVILPLDFASTVPTVKVQVDRLMSHSTRDFPVEAKLDFWTDGFTNPNGCPPVLQTDDITFPTAVFAGGNQMDIDMSTDGGKSWALMGSHTFNTISFADIASLVADINGDAGFMAASLIADNEGNKLIIRPNPTGFLAGPKTALRFSPTSVNVFNPDPINVVEGTRAFGGGAVALGGTKKLYARSFSNTNTVQVNDFITLYAAERQDLVRQDEAAGDPDGDVAWIGTYKVLSTGIESSGRYKTLPFITIDRLQDFADDQMINTTPDLFVQTALRWVVHLAPSVTPTLTSGGGTEISTVYVRFRLYSDLPEKRTISIPWSNSPSPLDEDSDSQVTLLDQNGTELGVASEGHGHLHPYRVLRPGVRRISSTAMKANRDGALYFIDLDLIGYGPAEDMNIAEEEALLMDGRRNIAGYLLRVEDQNFTFSEQERVSIILPSAVLPVGSTPDLDNTVRLSGQNIQVIQNASSLVSDVQRFLSSPLDRVVVANTLARHFLPAYVSIDASYSGGSGVTVVAGDIIDYINGIDPNDNTLRLEDIIEIIQQRGAEDVTLPIVAVALVYGIDRRIRAMRSSDFIGPAQAPTFVGTFKQLFFIPGDDTSLETERPDGEQIYLTRL